MSAKGQKQKRGKAKRGTPRKGEDAFHKDSGGGGHQSQETEARYVGESRKGGKSEKGES